MKQKIFSLLSAACLLVAGSAVAQDITRQAETTAREACIEQGSADKCVEWTATASCVMNYREHLPEVAKLVSDSDLQKYRIQAASKLPKGCTNIASILLQIEILNSDLSLKSPQLSKSDREKRWLSVVDMAGKPDIIPQQHILIASEIANSPDFESLKKQPKVQKLITKASDEALDLLPDIAQETASLFTQLDSAAPDLITQRGAMVMALYDIRGTRYLSARQRLATIDLSKFTAGDNAKFKAELQKNGINLVDRNNYMDAECFSELPLSAEDNNMLALYKSFMDMNSDAAIYIQQAETPYFLRSCSFEPMMGQFAQILSQKSANTDVKAYLDNLVKYIEKTPEPGLVRQFVTTMSHLSGEAQALIKRQYSARIAQFAATQARYDIAAKSYDAARQVASDALNLVNDTDACELRLQYGRALELLKNRSQSRQQWGYIIEHSPAGVCKDSAYALSIQSFIADGKKADAETLSKQRKH